MSFIQILSLEVSWSAAVNSDEGSKACMSHTSDAEPSFGFITPFVLPAFNPLLDLEIEKKYGQKWAGSVVVHNISTCTTVQ